MERGAYRTMIEHALLIAHGVQFDPSLFHPSSFRPLSCLSIAYFPLGFGCRQGGNGCRPGL